MFTYIPAGDSAFIIKAGDDISPETNAKVHALLAEIEKRNMHGIIDFIPSYNELMICYDPIMIDHRVLFEQLKQCADNVSAATASERRRIHIPVLYGGAFGPDMSEVAQQHDITEKDLIAKHTAPDYPVYMLGFTPGFCYLGGMDASIATPRRAAPRTKIPAGSVGIADKQTGIYPIESPGGWNLIGRTPLILFDKNKADPFLINAGDILRFYAISEQEYHDISTAVAAGTFSVNKERTP